MCDFLIGLGLVAVWISALAEYAGAGAVAGAFEWAAAAALALLGLRTLWAVFQGAEKKLKKFFLGGRHLK
jgi:hypothetical protein